MEEYILFTLLNDKIAEFLNIENLILGHRACKTCEEIF